MLLLTGTQQLLPRLSHQQRGISSKKYVASIDQGTSSTRFMIFSVTGEVVSMHQEEHKQMASTPGHSEHNPIEIWQKTQQCIEGAMKKLDLTSNDIAAVGITNQRETTVVWNKKTGKPYHNAIVWNDLRTTLICDKLAQLPGGKNRLREKTGLPLAPYFSATKLMYLLDTVDGLRRDAEAGEALFGNIDTWLMWNLTGGGVHVTDVTNASRTMMMNLHTLQWDDEILSELKIPQAMLPLIKPSSGLFGHVVEGASSSLQGVPIAGVLGDQQAALFGQCCFEVGMAKCTYGTGAFLLMNTGHRPVPSNSGLLTTVGYQLGAGGRPVYALEGSVAYAGLLIQWLRDNLQVIGSAKEGETLAATVDDNGGVYFVPAFSGLYAPYWRSDARGLIAGLTLYNTKAHVVRAALEAAAFQVTEVVDAMEKDAQEAQLGLTGEHSLKLLVDGGMTSNETLMQFQADMLGVSIQRPRSAETSALGAAFAAGLGVQYWTSLEQLKSVYTAGQVWHPIALPAERIRQLHNWKKAISRSLGWIEGPPQY